jgi:hypothetical protein
LACQRRCHGCANLLHLPLERLGQCTRVCTRTHATQDPIHQDDTLGRSIGQRAETILGLVDRRAKTLEHPCPVHARIG